MTAIDLTPEQISTLVHQPFPDAGIVSVERIAGTHTHLYYRLQLDNLMDAVLKVYGSGHAASAPDREIRLLGMLTSETGVPVPRVLHFAGHLPGEPQSGDASHSWALLTHLPGQPLSAVIDTLDDWEHESVGYEMGRYLAHIHKLPLVRFGALFLPGPYDHVSEKGYILAQARQWLEECAQAELLDKEVSTALCRHFEETDLLVHRQACLIHGDFRVKNVLVEQGATGHHVTGILDYTHALGGSPELDVSTLFAWDLQTMPAVKKGFLDGYADIGELSARFWERLSLYQSFISLHGLLLAHQIEQEQMEQTCRERIRQYLDGATASHTET
jgi:aminoglycoside phosphotransferase (APT) family kinase protein